MDLANVEETCNSDNVLLSYLKNISQSKDGEIWAYPEVPEALKPNTSQLISGCIEVSYFHSCYVANEKHWKTKLNQVNTRNFKHFDINTFFDICFVYVSVLIYIFYFIVFYSFLCYKYY